MGAKWSWLGLGWQEKQKGGTNSRVKCWGGEREDLMEAGEFF